MPRNKKVEKEEVYHVEVITKARVNEDAEWEYLVKWAGYGSDADSWEPSENVMQCDRLLASFWKHVGMDNNDYPSGFEVVAQEDWINKEKQYFQETFVKSSKRKSGKSKDRQRRKSKSSTSHISESTSDESESSDEESSMMSPPVTKRVSRNARVDTESESASESDGHSRQLARVSRPKATTAPSKAIPKVSTPVQHQEMPSATGGSTSIAPPKPAVRTHQDQRTHPLVKSMNIPPASVEAGSSLSTKQRIAAGIPPPRTGPKPLPVGPKKSLQALSFKKNKPTIPLASHTKDAPTSSTSVATPTSPVVPSTDITYDADVVASPEPMDVDLWGSTSDDVGPACASSSDVPIVPVAPKSQDTIEAEKFLKTISIPALSARLEMDITPDQPVQPATEPTKTLAIQKIPKKWKWTGDLFISTSGSKTEPLCAVTVTDPGGTCNTSHINVLLSSHDSLRISKLYPIMDITPIFRACGKPQFYGTLESSEPSEQVVIHGLDQHMRNEGLAAIIPLLLDATEVAVLVIFPGAQQGLAKVLQVPEHLSTGTHLVVVLLPLLVPVIASATVAGQRSIEAVMQSSFDLQNALVPDEPPQMAMLYQAMTLLHFPKALLDFFNSTSPKLYCIWPSAGHQGLDTFMLQYILGSTRAVPVKIEEDVRVVFISNQHLETLHTMPSLVTKLVNHPEVQFWTYGYSASMISESWKVQEVYPLGGVVTFTPSALAEDLMGCCHLMSQIIEHPLWDCYLIPEVLAVTHLFCNDGDLGTSSEICLGSILDFINLGLISVIRMPQQGHSNQMAWLSQSFDLSSASGSELLDTYMGVLRSHPATSGMTTEQLINFTNNEIAKDLANARIQPTFMKGYRRFVVIQAASEDTIPFEKDGLEWTTISTFSFKDGYFQL